MRANGSAKPPGRRQFLAGISCSAALGLLSACAGQNEPTSFPARLQIVGSTSMGRLLAELASAYQMQHPRVLVDVQGGNTAAGLAELTAGGSNLAAVSWSEGASGLPPHEAIPVARDGIAVIVHPSNRCSGLTLSQLRALYQGEVLDWGSMGGLQAQPVIVSREDGSGTRAGFESLGVGNERVTLNALVMPSSATMVDYVARHRAAVGYVSMAYLNAVVKALPIEGALPSSAAIKSGTYHLSRVLYLYLRMPSAPVALNLLDFLRTRPAQLAIERLHVPLD